jgi:two-component system cell cycle response regulator
MVAMPRAVRWAYLLVGAWLAVSAVRNAFFPHVEAGPLFHRYAHDLALGTVGILCLVRVVVAKHERLPWALIGAGICAWTAGEIYYTGVLWTVATVPFPSPADAGYLLMPPLVLAGSVLLLRRRHPGLPSTVRVDALTAALAVGAFGASQVFDTVKESLADDPLGAATALAYPLWDLVIGGFIVGAMAAVGARAGRAWLLLGAGIVVFWISDSLYLVKTAEGTFTSPSWFDAGWWIGLTCVSLAAWQPAVGARETVEREGIGQIAVPLGFASAGLVMLVVGAADSTLNLLAVGLSAGALIAVMSRLALTFRENLAMLAHSRGEALSDALTGLPNRRALSRHLDRAIALADDERPLVLVLFDLDGFKAYNDAFGHPAGDELLVRLGGNLRRYLDGRGTAFRMGGDEFCAVFTPGESVAEPIIAGAGAALSERGEGFAIGCSYGSIFLPREAQSATEALRIADQRMYAQKSAGRASAGRQSTDVLLRALAERSPGLSSHLHDVADLAQAVARRLGLPDDRVEQIRLAAELHDVGKVAIPDAILEKPAALDDDEWAFMRRHTLIGERIISAAPALQGVAALVRSSHERWDGAGYPDRLKGEQIPLGSRIVAVADAFDAMTARRTYCEPRTPDQALAELRRCSDGQFDPVVVQAFCASWAARAAAAASA